MAKKIALLATGNEIVEGLVLNSNGPYCAQHLVENKMQPGMQLSVTDDIKSIEQGIRFLLKEHDALITIGGLGPTSDDVTRNGLSQALQLPLIFDENSWQHIQHRFAQRNYIVTENNRQQCYFPQNAVIISNSNGSANACYIFHEQKHIFMLPGPPDEFQPLLHQYVLPLLATKEFAEHYFTHEWLLMGLGESHAADLFDPICQKEHVEIAYCVNRPYLQIRLKTKDKAALQRAISVVHEDIKGFIQNVNQRTS